MRACRRITGKVNILTTHSYRAARRWCRITAAAFLNFDFGTGSPGAACGLSAEYFSARWTRTVNFGAGLYRFSVTGDDGVRVYVGGQLKIDKWLLQAPPPTQLTWI